MLVVKRARKTLEKIRPSIEDMIALRSYMESWNNSIDKLSIKLNGTEFSAPHKVITNAILQSLLLGVCRVWDRGRDTFSFRNLERLIGSGDVADTIRGDRYEGARLSGILEFSELVNGYKDSDECRAMFVSRAEGFAHLVEVSRERQRMITPRLVNHGELYRAVDLSIECYNKADLVLNSNTVAYEFLIEDFDRLFRRVIDDIPKYTG